MVSVIIPNYNHAAYLKKRIDSILNQTYRDFEVIILDDCSTDQSKEVIDRYKDHPSISGIYYNERNSGSTFKQWNKGIQFAQGDYVWIAESDDFCEPTFLEELIFGFDNYPNVGLAFCQSMFITAENRITGTTHTGHLSEMISGEVFLKSKMLGTNTIVNASMAVFRKSKVKLVPDDYLQMKYCGDWLFWVNLCLLGDVYISGKYLNYYLRHANNVASNATRQGYDFLEGNKIYHFITSKISVQKPEKENALKERAVEYLRTRYNFLDENIKKQVWASMMQLDPDMNGVLQKMIWKARRIDYATKLKKWLLKGALKHNIQLLP